MGTKKRKCKIYAVLCFLSLFIGLGFSACSTSTPFSPEKANHNKPFLNQEPKDFEALTEIKEGQKDIYLILKYTDNEYFNVIKDGAIAAANTYSCNLYYSGTENENDCKGQEKLINTALSRGADGIMITPNAADLLSDSIASAQKQVPVVLLDSIINTTNYEVCYMTDNLKAGKDAAREMISLIEDMGYDSSDKVTIGIEISSPSINTISERLAGFCNLWESIAPPKWTILSEVKSNNMDHTQIAKDIEGFIKDYPNLVGIFSTNKRSTDGAATYLLDNNIKNIALVGFDYCPSMEKMITETDSGYHASMLLQDQYSMGYKGVNAVIDAISGTSHNQKFFDTGLVIVNQDTLLQDGTQQILTYNK